MHGDGLLQTGPETFEVGTESRSSQDVETMVSTGHFVESIVTLLWFSHTTS